MLNRSTDRNENEAHQALLPLIKQEADRHGVLSFARFMELALYTPGLGFYQRSEKVIGRSGDFFTSVSVGRLLGQLLACQFGSWIKKSRLKNPVIVESGAHGGQLAADILLGLKSMSRPTFEATEYWIVEPSGSRTIWQRTQLKDYLENVRWFHSWTELSSFRDTTGQPLEGIVFSNELLDAMPAHRLQWNKSSAQWLELGVARCGEGLMFQQMPLSDEAQIYGETVGKFSRNADAPLLWPDIPNPLLEALPDGFITDICPAALDWWKTAAEALHRGWLLAIDYGGAAGDFFTPRRNKGTVRGYRDHKFADDILADPGEQDITADVNFTAVGKQGESLGLKTERFEPQSKFLTRIFADLWPRETTPFTPENIRQFHTLTHPDHLGRAFNVLLQSRDVAGRH